ncbi:ArsR/SmtB family transcription factor [Isachenkonia alkalipeptolytica]|uniref:Winged helix-turn-helix transcriptional regulator n=1 Tax=Isachenkonia alkalipeptolytica TaxID=2565777 RepID=A0AA44BD92_9CLOT|nr:metalloregulator ArsR/SmtB family transcription factor [Isachenkonia alkalipeptolytica]NBG88079.1 winged helix-turn-helix transcriptional regulator [Isachenkonia alkalipeptolytica]
MEIVEILKALGDDTRVRVLHLIQEKPLCVCEIQEILGISQSNTSRHLIKLKNAKLIRGDKKAQWVYYSLDPDTFGKYSFLEELMKNLNLYKDLDRDRQALQRLQEKGFSCETLTKG